MSDYDDHDWYEDDECPHCGELRECEHGDDDGDDGRRLYLRFDRTEAIAEKALARCGITQDAEAWPEAFSALVRRLGEQADDPLEQRRPGWTVAPPF